LFRIFILKLDIIFSSALVSLSSIFRSNFLNFYYNKCIYVYISSPNSVLARITHILYIQARIRLCTLSDTGTSRNSGTFQNNEAWISGYGITKTNWAVKCITVAEATATRIKFQNLITEIECNIFTILRALNEGRIETCGKYGIISKCYCSNIGLFEDCCVDSHDH
jgi:hypothetical protein